MNDNPGDDPGSGDIHQQDLISDDVAEAITSAIKGEEMPGSATPATTVKPTVSKPSAPTAPADQGGQPHGQAPAEPVAPSGPPPAEPAAVNPPAASDHPEVTDRGSGNVSELYDIKQQALKQLGPLVQHLDQGPEEKFETLIMMLRASDDPALIQPAYDAAQAIDDDKQRAQALLDVINEVNYLTRPTED